MALLLAQQKGIPELDGAMLVRRARFEEWQAFAVTGEASSRSCRKEQEPRPFQFHLLARSTLQPGELFLGFAVI